MKVRANGSRLTRLQKMTTASIVTGLTGLVARLTHRHQSQFSMPRLSRRDAENWWRIWRTRTLVELLAQPRHKNGYVREVLWNVRRCISPSLRHLVTREVEVDGIVLRVTGTLKDVGHLQPFPERSRIVEGQPKPPDTHPTVASFVKQQTEQPGTTLLAVKHLQNNKKGA